MAQSVVSKQELQQLFLKLIEKSENPVELEMLRQSCRHSEPPSLVEAIDCICSMLDSGQVAKYAGHTHDRLNFPYPAYGKPQHS